MSLRKIVTLVDRLFTANTFRHTARAAATVAATLATFGSISDASESTTAKCALQVGRLSPSLLQIVPETTLPTDIELRRDTSGSYRGAWVGTLPRLAGDSDAFSFRVQLDYFENSSRWNTAMGQLHVVASLYSENQDANIIFGRTNSDHVPSPFLLDLIQKKIGVRVVATFWNPNAIPHDENNRLNSTEIEEAQDTWVKDGDTKKSHLPLRLDVVCNVENQS